jgi:hypothetical protein
VLIAIFAQIFFCVLEKNFVRKKKICAAKKNFVRWKKIFSTQYKLLRVLPPYDTGFAALWLVFCRLM